MLKAVMVLIEVLTGAMHDRCKLKAANEPGGGNPASPNRPIASHSDRIRIRCLIRPGHGDDWPCLMMLLEVEDALKLGIRQGLSHFNRLNLAPLSTFFRRATAPNF